MTKRFRLDRRTFLRGAGGVALALPALEIMMPSAKAAMPAPKRFFLGLGGISTGMQGSEFDLSVPKAVGSGYEITRGLGPLGDQDLGALVSVVSGMEIPWGDEGSVPAGGRPRRWHSTSMGPLISGVRCNANTVERPLGETADQVAADVLAGDTTHRLLTYRVQAARYRGQNGDGGDRGRASYRKVGDELVPVDPIVSPRLAYDSLFTGFIPPDPEEAAQALAAIRRRKSAVDLVGDAAKDLIPKLGGTDKQRMERHFDELRELEKRLDELKPPPANESCVLLPEPGPDPEIGGAVENNDTDGFESGGAYSNEELRAEIMTDLMAMAFICDLSRVVSMLYTMPQCFLNCHPILGHPTDMHQLGHFGPHGGNGDELVADGVSWHVKHWSTLVAKLRDTPDIDGMSTVLDNCALVLAFEGGWGEDPESGKEFSSHSSQNMFALIAGGAGGLNAAGGKHVQNIGGHPTQVINSALRAVGVEQEMGEIAGVVDGLF